MNRFRHRTERCPHMFDKSRPELCVECRGFDPDAYHRPSRPLAPEVRARRQIVLTLTLAGKRRRVIAESARCTVGTVDVHRARLREVGELPPAETWSEEGCSDTCARYRYLVDRVSSAPRAQRRAAKRAVVEHVLRHQPAVRLDHLVMGDYK